MRNGESEDLLCTRSLRHIAWRQFSEARCGFLVTVKTCACPWPLCPSSRSWDMSHAAQRGSGRWSGQQRASEGMRGWDVAVRLVRQPWGPLPPAPPPQPPCSVSGERCPCPENRNIAPASSVERGSSSDGSKELLQNPPWGSVVLWCECQHTSDTQQWHRPPSHRPQAPRDPCGTDGLYNIGRRGVGAAVKRVTAAGCGTRCSCPLPFATRAMCLRVLNFLRSGKGTSTGQSQQSLCCLRYGC